MSKYTFIDVETALNASESTPRSNLPWHSVFGQTKSNKEQYARLVVFVQLTRAEVADNKKRKRNRGGSTSSEGSGGVDCLEKVTQKAIERAVVASEKASAAAVSANVASNAVAMLNAENEKQRIALATAQLAASTAREEANAAHSTRLMEQMFQFMRDNQQQARQDISNQQTRK